MSICGEQFYPSSGPEYEVPLRFLHQQLQVFILRVIGMIENFYFSQENALPALQLVPPPASVILGLRSVPKEDTGFCISKAMFRTPLTVPGVFQGGWGASVITFLAEDPACAVSRFAVSPPHYVPRTLPTPLPPHLANSRVCVFARRYFGSISSPTILWALFGSWVENSSAFSWETGLM